MKIADLSLKANYYDEIAKGRKKTEYRTLNGATGNYYVGKFLNADSYAGKTTDEIREGLATGRIKEIHTNGITHLRFHCLGRMMLVEVRGIRVEGRNLCIDLGKVSNIK